MFNRRSLIKSASGAFTLNAVLPGWAHSASSGRSRPLPALSGPDIALTIDHASWTIDGRDGHAIVDTRRRLGEPGAVDHMHGRVILDRRADQ